MKSARNWLGLTGIRFAIWLFTVYVCSVTSLSASDADGGLPLGLAVRSVPPFVP